MKKFFLITFILLFTFNLTYAEDDCSLCTIKDAQAEVLQKFIENQRKIISRISSKAS
jgi:hypothetical protein